MVTSRDADLVHEGRSFTTLRQALDALVAKVQERVTGVVRLKLFKGDCRVVGRRAPFALYDQALEMHDAGDAFDQGAAAAPSRSLACQGKQLSARRDPMTNDR